MVLSLHAYKTDETKEYGDLLYFSGFFVINDLYWYMYYYGER